MSHAVVNEWFQRLRKVMFLSQKLCILEESMPSRLGHASRKEEERLLLVPDILGLQIHLSSPVFMHLMLTLIHEEPTREGEL